MSHPASDPPRTRAEARRAAGPSTGGSVSSDRADNALDRSTTRLGWMDTLRGLAILLVILHHSTQIVANAAGAGELPAVFASQDVPAVLAPFIFVSNFFAPFRMPMLVFLSGLLVSGSLQRPAGQYVWGKLRRILWPIIVWTFVYAAANAVGGGGMTYLPWEWGFWNTYLWFMQFVLVYYLAALLIKWVPAWVFVVLPMAVLVVLELAEAGGAELPPLLPRLLYLMPFFFLGAFIERFWDRFVTIVSLPFAVAMAAIPLALGLVSALWTPLWYEPYIVIPALLGILALARIAVYIPDARWLTPVRFVGRYSLIYYVSHYPAYAAIFNIAERVGVTDPAIALPAVLVATIAVSTAFALIGRSLPFSLLFELPRRLWPARKTA